MASPDRPSHHNQEKKQRGGRSGGSGWCLGGVGWWVVGAGASSRFKEVTPVA